MDEQEVRDEVERSFNHSMVKALPVGHLLTIGVSLLAAAISWGVNSAKVTGLEESVRELAQREMTPGAMAAVSAIHARDAAQDRQILELREEMRDQRAEILIELRTLREELRLHDKER